MGRSLVRSMIPFVGVALLVLLSLIAPAHARPSSGKTPAEVREEDKKVARDLGIPDHIIAEYSPDPVAMDKVMVESIVNGAVGKVLAFLNAERANNTKWGVCVTERGMIEAAIIAMFVLLLVCLISWKFVADDADRHYRIGSNVWIVRGGSGKDDKVLRVFRSLDAATSFKDKVSPLRRNNEVKMRHRHNLRVIKIRLADIGRDVSERPLWSGDSHMGDAIIRFTEKKHYIDTSLTTETTTDASTPTAAPVAAITPTAAPTSIYSAINGPWGPPGGHAHRFDAGLRRSMCDMWEKEARPPALSGGKSSESSKDDSDSGDEGVDEVAICTAKAKVALIAVNCAKDALDDVLSKLAGVELDEVIVIETAALHAKYAYEHAKDDMVAADAALAKAIKRADDAKGEGSAKEGATGAGDAN